MDVKLTAILSAKVDAFVNGINQATGKLQALGTQTEQTSKKAQSSIKEMGNVSSLILGNLAGGTLGALGGSFGVAGAAIGTFADKAISLTMQISKVSDQFNAYRIVLQNVTGSQIAAANAFDFAIQKANESGFEIGQVTQAYKGFIGSGRQAGLSLTELNAIFQGTTRYGATFALTSDEMSGSLLALSQMLSKSTVSAEELRGQLGERMPGAFSLFAKAMGVSESKLGKMLEQGQVLAKDALPKFAAELEKASASKYSKNLDTISGSFTVLTNNVNLLLDAIGQSSQINNFFSSFNKGLTNVVANLAALVKSGEWAAFFSALGGNQAAMGMGAVERAFQSRKGFSQMDETGRTSKIYQQIELVSNLQKRLDSLSAVYAKTGQKEAEYFQTRANVEKATAFLDSLIKIDEELNKAERPIKGIVSPKIVDPKITAKLLDEYVALQLNASQSITDSLQRVRDISISLIIDETERKRAELKAQAADSRVKVETEVQNEQQKAREIRLINEKLDQDLRALAAKPQAITSRSIGGQQVDTSIQSSRNALQMNLFGGTDPLNTKGLENAMNKLLGVLKQKSDDINNSAKDAAKTIQASMEGMVRSSLGGLGGIAEKQINEIVARFNQLPEGIQAMKLKMATMLSMAADTLGKGFEAFGEALATGKNPFAAFGKAMLKSLGEILSLIGRQMLQRAAILFALGAATSGFSTGYAAKMALGGAALITAGSAISSVKLAKGGLAFGPTLATVGDNVGASYDPEVVSPLSKLREYMGGGGQTIRVEGIISNDTIRLSNSRGSQTRQSLRGRG